LADGGRRRHTHHLSKLEERAIPLAIRRCTLLQTLCPCSRGALADDDAQEYVSRESAMMPFCMGFSGSVLLLTGVAPSWAQDIEPASAV